MNTTDCLPQDVSTFWMHRVGYEKGLTNLVNYNIYHDSQGFVWISSLTGLFRYDGIETKQYSHNPSDSTSLLGTYVESDFFEDDNHNIWFSTNQAIHCYQRAHDNFLKLQINNSDCQPIIEDYEVFHLEKSRFLWVKIKSEVYRIDLFNLGNCYTPIVEIGKDLIRCSIGAPPDENIEYLFAYYGWEKNGLEYYSINDGCPDESKSKFVGEHSIFDIYYENKNVVWLGTKNGVIRWNIEYSNIDYYPIFQEIGHYITAYDNENLLLTAKGKGLFLFHKKNGVASKITCRNATNKADSTDLNMILPYLDQADNLWLPMEGEQGGVIHTNLNKTKFQSISMIEEYGNQAASTYQSLIQDENGNIWCSTFFNGIYLLDTLGKIIHHYTTKGKAEESLLSNFITHMIKDSQGRIWIATFDGISFFDGKKFTHIPLPDDLPNRNFLYLHELKKNNKILASSLSSGIFEIKEGKEGYMGEIIIPAESFTYFNIYEDTTNQLYLCRNEINIEVFKYDNHNYTKEDTINISGSINAFYHNPSSGNIWFGTSNGLIKINKNKHDVARFLFSKESGLPDDFIHAILPQKDGKMYLSTNKGLAIFDAKNGSSSSFTIADGIQSNVFLSYAALRLKNSEVWFGGANGITIIKKNGIDNIDTIPPRIKVREIKINNEIPKKIRDWNTKATNISEIKHLKIPFKDNTVSIEFVALGYSDPSNNRLSYKLVNMDQKWVDLEKGEVGLASYSNLWIGSYQLIARAYNSDGQSSDNYIELLTITIEAPWYLTSLAMVTYILLSTGIFYSIYRFRINQIRKKEEMLRKEAEFRQKEAEMKQQMAETETAILRLQMNPHFIFNSMNSINSYILKKDIDTASDYLGRFSKLMRMILDLAANKYISVFEEAELLELYMKTEAMRFENKFDYKLIIDDCLDPDDTVLPTMILQPFVENAIWHGLSGKSKKGHIAVRFQKTKESLICSVTDNGIGRKASGNKLSSNKNHESKALSITKRRLQLLEEESGKPSSYEIIDLESENGQASGTKIILILPLL